MNLRPSIRLRLTLLYGGLFLAAGTLLLVVNYGLVSSRLPEVTTADFRGPTGELPPPPMAPGVVEFVVPVPVDSPEARRFQAEFARQAAAFRSRTLEQLVVQSASALGLMAIASVGLGWVVAGRVLRPLHQITATARRLSQENLHERIALDGPSDELKELADTFDEMLGRLDAAFESQRRFIANASHELRTPLTIQRTLIDVALADPTRGQEDMAAIADDLRHAIDRSERLIESLLLLARSERRVEAWRDVDLATVTGDAFSALQTEAEARGIRLDRTLEPAVARGDPALLERLAWNLVENAVRHNVDDGWVSASTSVDGRLARLTVSNSGPEIDDAAVPQLLEHFRRLDSDRTGSARGSGLGLSIVRAVVDAHKGHLRVRARPGGGLEVDVLLPAS